MRIYSIFDDFGENPSTIIRNAGGDLTVHPMGKPRPSGNELKELLENYDCIIISTGQKIREEMFDNIETPRIIATASVGIDHISIPKGKNDLVTIIKTPKANAQSVAEYTMGCALSCIKRLHEGYNLYRAGKNNKQLIQKPEDLLGKTIGVVGAGNISVRIMEYAKMFGMKVICWTRNPDKHKDLLDLGVSFVELRHLASVADVISVNLPNKIETVDFISREIVDLMKDNAIFISVSRFETVNVLSLLEKAKRVKTFYVCLDLDVNESILDKIPDQHNVLVTPHIAGGTVETRKRMFRELAEQIAQRLDCTYE